MGKRRRKARRSIGKVIECGIIFYSWWIEAKEDRIISKEEQKEILSDLLDVWGDTDIRLE